MPQPEHPIETIRLSSRDKKKIVQEINSAQTAHLSAESERRGLRVDYNIGAVFVLLTHPNGSMVKYSVVPRNLSGKGLGFIHGQFLHVGSVCSVLLPTLKQGAMKIPGKIVRCRHLRGLMHEVSVQFEESIDVSQFVRLGTEEEAKARQELDIFQIGRVVLNLPDVTGGRIKYSLTPKRLNTSELSVVYHRAVPENTPIEVVFMTAAEERLRSHGRVLTSTALSEGVFEVVVGFNVPVLKHDLEDTTEPGTPVPPPSGKVLLVDDFESDRKLMRLWLRKMGLTVVEASNTTEAMEAIKAGGFDLVIQDLVLGAENGLDVIKQMRAGGYAGPIVAVSADDREGAVASVLAAGGNGFVSKPTDPNSVSQIITQLLSVAFEEASGSASEPLQSSMTQDAEMKPMIEAFVGQLASYTEKLNTLCKAGDYDGVARLCFQLKGAGSSHGFTVISKVAKLAMDTLQQPARDLDTVRRSIEDLIAVIDRVKA